MNITEAAVTGELADAVAEQSRQSLDRLDPERGVLLDAVWLREAGVLVLTAHVLAMDPCVVAHRPWRTRCRPGMRSPRAESRHRCASTPATGGGPGCWSSGPNGSTPVTTGSLNSPGRTPNLGARRIRPQTDRARDVAVTLSVTDPEVSATLLDGDQPITHLLAAAAARMVNQWRLRRNQSRPAPLLALETHGRADTVTADADTSDTVGLLSTVYPLRVPSADARSIGEAIEAIPGDGIDYGLLRYLRADTAERLRAHHEPQLLLNFLGRIDYGVSGEGLQLDRTLLVRRFGAARARGGDALRADYQRVGAHRG